MSEQFSMQIASAQSHWDPSKLKIIHTDVNTPVGDDDIYIVIQSDINLHRKVEILEGLRFLSNWMRDSNQLSAAAGAIYTFVDIDRRHEDVNQASDISGVSTTDLLIGVGANVNTIATGGTDSFNEILESGFTMLRQYANDEFLKFK